MRISCQRLADFMTCAITRNDEEHAGPAVAFRVSREIRNAAFSPDDETPPMYRRHLL